MARKCLEYFALIVLFQVVAQVHLQTIHRRASRGNNHIACEYVQCEKTETCVHRKFRCKNPPCPGMLYCARSRTESLRGPRTCDTVHCSTGYLCMVKVRHCLWDQKCKQQIARCVSRQEYHEGPASCAGFECPQGHRCILRESLCANPPCKLLRSCSKNRDVHIWFGKCRNLGCSSEFDCFLRKPENTCSDPPCKHTSDCITAAEDQVENADCRGWICPRMHKCVAKTVMPPCESNNCEVNRTCNTIPQDYSSIRPESLNNRNSVYANGLLRDANVTNVTRVTNVIELSGKKRLFVPEYNSSEAEIFHALEIEKEKEKEKEKKEGKETVVLPFESTEKHQFPSTNDTKHSRTLPIENNKITDTQINNPNTAARQNEDIRDTQMDDFSFNVPETFKYLPLGHYDLPSLWTGSDQSFEKEASADTTIDSFSEISETVSVDTLEMLIKSLARVSNETVQRDQSYPENLYKNYASSAVPYFGDDRFTSKNLEEVVDQSSSYGAPHINFTYNSEPRVDDTVRSSNLADQSYSSDEGISSIRSTDAANNEAGNFDSFFEMDKEALLSYIEALIEDVDLQNDSSSETNRNMDIENAETDPRTPEPSYEDKELQFTPFYNLPSYGASGND